MSDGQINMINTISSIAQHYEVGLDVIRMVQESDRLMVEPKQGINITTDKLIRLNLIDYVSAAMETYAKL